MSTSPPPRNPWLAHAGMVAAWIAVAVAAGLSMPRHSGHVIPISGHVMLGAIGAILVSTAALGVLGAFGPLTTLKLGAAHALGLLLGFGGLAGMLAETALFSLEVEKTQSAICSNFPVKAWRLGPDPGSPGDQRIEVLVHGAQSGTVRLSFVMLYDSAGSSTHSSKSWQHDDPMIPIPATGDVWLGAGLKPNGGAPAWYQFAICTTPGAGTSGCGWWGYGDLGIRKGEISPPCALPPPS